MKIQTGGKIALWLTLTLIIALSPAANAVENRAAGQGNGEVKAEVRGPEPLVRIFGTDWCGYCKKAREYFTKKKVPFVEHNIEKDEDAARIFRKLNPQGSVPVVIVGQYLIRGYSEESFDKALELTGKEGK